MLGKVPRPNDCNAATHKIRPVWCMTTVGRAADRRSSRHSIFAALQSRPPDHRHEGHERHDETVGCVHFRSASDRQGVPSGIRLCAQPTLAGRFQFHGDTVVQVLLAHPAQCVRCPFDIFTGARCNDGAVGIRRDGKGFITGVACHTCSTNEVCASRDTHSTSTPHVTAESAYDAACVQSKTQCGIESTASSQREVCFAEKEAPLKNIRYASRCRSQAHHLRNEASKVCQTRIVR